MRAKQMLYAVLIRFKTLPRQSKTQTAWSDEEEERKSDFYCCCHLYPASTGAVYFRKTSNLLIDVSINRFSQTDKASDFSVSRSANDVKWIYGVDMQIIKFNWF